MAYYVETRGRNVMATLSAQEANIVCLFIKVPTYIIKVPTRQL